jgi:uncharacterized protein (DUF58 family)
VNGTPLLDPALLARLGALKLRVRAITEGVLSGLHRSPHHGQSVEFAEHREYAPGDELRHLDWKALGRFDRYYVKRFEQETNLRAHLVVDASGSMAFRGREDRPSKLEVAGALAASLAWLLVRQQDAAGLLLANDRVVRAVPPRATASHLPHLVETLAAAEGAGPTRLGAALDWLVENARRRAAVVLFTDLLDADEAVMKRVAQLAKRKHEVTLFHVLDPAELEFPYDDPTLFTSMEDGRSVEAAGRDVRRGYLEEVGRWLEATKRAAAEADVDYALVRTDAPLEQVLLPFLARRARHAA